MSRHHTSRPYKVAKAAIYFIALLLVNVELEKAKAERIHLPLTWQQWVGGEGQDSEVWHKEQKEDNLLIQLSYLLPIRVMSTPNETHCRQRKFKVEWNLLECSLGHIWPSLVHTTLYIPFIKWNLIPGKLRWYSCCADHTLLCHITKAHVDWKDSTDCYMVISSFMS